MGQAKSSTSSYDRALNEKNSLPALNFLGSNLSWHRLDDGVMGGRSETLHECIDGAGTLHFKGTINTEGGGFTSIRSPISDSGLPKDMEALRIKFRGDGKTYKVLLSDGKRSTGAPFSRSPSWQIDLPTNKSDNNCDIKNGEGDDFQEVVLSLKDFQPSFGGGPSSRPSVDEIKKCKLIASDMRQIGFMLSLRLSDGRPNPPETFGQGIFDFSLEIDSITPVTGLN